MASKYYVYADGRVEQDNHPGLIGALVRARTQATAREGVKFRVDRIDDDGGRLEVARYHRVGSTLTRWVL